MKACVIGGGGWGSAFAIHLGRLGFPTRLWIREPEIVQAARRSRENPVFLPGYEFPAGVTFHDDCEEALAEAEAVFIAVPSQHCRRIYGRLSGCLRPGQAVVSLTKGIEKSSLRRMTEIMAECWGPRLKPAAVLSGPSFSREVAEGHPTALVLASPDSDEAHRLQRLLSGPSLRIYTSRDVVGVELSGALKNVIAVAAGISDALCFGHNSRASLLTRGLAEIARLGLRLGAQRTTFAGLAGMGDLVLTCTGHLSRNRQVGLELGAGRRLADVVGEMRMVAEGIPTTVSAYHLGKREGIEMPIIEQVYAVLYRRKDPRRALSDLMARVLKDE
jgi:glycerol-3-phosphate dehydrogenase (NAD(P)+)